MWQHKFYRQVKILTLLKLYKRVRTHTKRTDVSLMFYYIPPSLFCNVTFTATRIKALHWFCLHVDKYYMQYLIVRGHQFVGFVQVFITSYQYIHGCMSINKIDHYIILFKHYLPKLNTFKYVLTVVTNVILNTWPNTCFNGLIYNVNIMYK